MARITITVKYEDAVQEGLDVVVGNIFSTVLTTDENGQTGGIVDEDFAALANVAIKHPTEGTRVTGPMLLEAGGSYEINIRD